MAAGSESIARLYTRAGDRGDTGLVGGSRVPKDAERIRAFGALDEFNSSLGVVLADLPPGESALRSTLARLQHETFVVMSELATPATHAAPAHRVEERHIRRIEQEIDTLSAEFEPLHTFVLPGGARVASLLQLARTVVRRAEREIVALHHVTPVRPEVLQWVNRVSDLLFAAALAWNRAAGVPETAPDYST